jgi:uncharacterized Fe-S center protein
MPKVYFAKEIETILNQIDFSQLGERVGIKVHFGEMGCETYISPGLVKQVYKKIESLGKSATLIECNVLYKGSRTNSADHLKTAKQHGFGDMQIDILDGAKGEEFIEINKCKIGKGIERYDSLVVLTHFKGHRSAGFGGAIKNIGMGFGSRAGKLDMHSNVRPIVSDRCVACGECALHCEAKAITMNEGKAVIDGSICTGCAMCIAVCPIKAMEVPWEGRTAEEMQKRIAEYTKAVLSKYPKPIYINVLKNITELCDCMGQKQAPMMADVGILYSADIVALEKASLDLVNEKSGGEFEKINEVDNKYQIDIAEELGLGSQKYELVII